MLSYLKSRQRTGQCGRSPTTKNCALQATAVCGSGERQPPQEQWVTSARGSLLCDEGIPSARKEGVQAVDAILPLNSTLEKSVEFIEINFNGS
ncbi:hypothetical protein TNCV_1230461 [Trichonephila clavipes]|nr:hypothetical protein TNCV_1230461 [Trichonephila clavipes]